MSDKVDLIEYYRKQFIERVYEEKWSEYYVDYVDKCIDVYCIKVTLNKTRFNVVSVLEKCFINSESEIKQLIDKFTTFNYDTSSTGNYKIVAYCFPDEDVEMCIQTCLSDILGRIELDKQFLEGLENKIIELKKEL